MLMSTQHEERFKLQTSVCALLCKVLIRQRLMARYHFNTDILKFTWISSMIFADIRNDSELSEASKWTGFEPCDIATKCSMLDSSNKCLSPKSENPPPEPPPTGPPTGPLPKPPISALTKSLDMHALRNNGFPSPDFTTPISRSRAGSVAPSSIDDANTTVSSRGPSRLGRISVYPNGSTETVGFFGESEPIKPREFAEDHAFSPRSSQVQSEASSHLDDRKHSQDISEITDTMSSLSLYSIFKNLAHIRELTMLQAQLQFERLLKRRYLQQIARIQKKKLGQSFGDGDNELYVLLISWPADDSLLKFESWILN